MTPTCTIHVGDCLEGLRLLPSNSIHCVVTSPPYYGLRDYSLTPTRWADGTVCCLGLEPTLQEFIAHMVEIFSEIRRVLKKDGTCWVNMGDSYAGTGDRAPNIRVGGTLSFRAGGKGMKPKGFKPKELLGVPWRLAFALQDDGWWLRQDIIWSKPNPMPESTKDRCTKSHEYIFLLTKSAHYFWDADAIAENVSPNTHARLSQNVEAQIGSARANGGGANHPKPMKAVVKGKSKAGDFGVKNNPSFAASCCLRVEKRNKRSVWTIPTYACKEAHFATFPPDLVKPCILAGCPVGGTTLDPFFGSGTTGMVALELGRSVIGFELNPEYAKIARFRTNVTPGLLF